MPKPKGHDVLKQYEVTNLLFFLAFIITLGVFVSWVFHSYENPIKSYPKKPPDDTGVLSEAFFPQTGSCLFYLGTKLTEGNRRYRGLIDVPATDDGLVRDLLGIPGVAEVVIDQKQVVLQLTPGGRWESIQPGAREIIKSHLHMHH